MNPLVMFSFTRTEVEQVDFSRFDRLFGHWPKEHGPDLAGKMGKLYLAIDGYNTDTRELYAIPEVRKFVCALHQHWPWWQYFLQLESKTLLIFYLCLNPQVSAVKRHGEPVCVATFEPEALLQLLQEDMIRMNTLCERAGLSEEVIEKRSGEIFSLFFRGVMEGRR